jgi:hypothetical protein
MRQIAIRFISIILLFSAAGCSSMMSSATSSLATSLTNGILNQNDPQLVADGVPAYLLLLDGMIGDEPENVGLLSAGARLYGAYASIFVDDPKRNLIMTDKAYDYSQRAMCLKLARVCAGRGKPYDEYVETLKSVSKNDMQYLYNFSVAWGGWIRARASDWTAIGALPKVRAGLERVAALDAGYDQGGAQLYLGVMATLLPKAMGGKPEQGQQYFERAMQMSDGRNLVVKVLYAERYARLVFDRELHDRLLKEVLAADAKAPGYTLSNLIAKEQAQKLLDSGKDYF